MLEEVTRNHIERILAVTDALGLHREQVMIPLLPRHPGRIRRTPQGKVEIVVDAGADFDQWVAALPDELRKLEQPGT
jgi:hypothetical protein